MSRVLNYRRFGDKGHGLEVWGEALNSPKGDFHEFHQYSEEMRKYCLQDVRLTVEVYSQLRAEMLEACAKNPLMKTYMRCETAVAKWCSLAYYHGWPFDTPKAKQLRIVLEKELEDATAQLEYKLGYKATPKDKKLGIVHTKHPKWVKSGFYDQHTANWFGIDVCSGYEGEERPVAGEYVRVDVEPLQLSSSTDVKIFLYRNGWEPLEYNTKWDPELKRKVETSPKITEESLEFLGGDGKLYKEYLTAVSRYGVLKGWLETVDENNLLRGRCKTIGTPSMRATHSIIVNVPSTNSPYGREMRELFGSMPGWSLIGCDSASNQARGLAHFLGDEEFTNTLLTGDIHKFNANILDNVLTSMGFDWSEWIIKSDKAQIKEEFSSNYASKEEYLRSGSESAQAAIFAVKRAAAKRVLYAFLFGASGKKMWVYIFGTADGKNGNKLKTGFTKAVPGFKDLLTKLENLYGASSKYGDGWIPSLCGGRVYVDSFHKLLVYLLQSTEKITCSAATMLTMERLEAAGIPYIPCIFMHDEIDYLVPDEHAEQAAEIGRQSFKDGAELFGITIMDGSKAIGRNWYDVH